MSKYSRLVEKELRSAKDKSNNNENINNSNSTLDTSSQEEPLSSSPATTTTQATTKKNRLTKRNSKSSPPSTPTTEIEKEEEAVTEQPSPKAASSPLEEEHKHAINTAADVSTTDAKAEAKEVEEKEEGEAEEMDMNEALRLEEEEEEEEEEEGEVLADTLHLQEDEDHCVVCCDACPHLVFHSYEALHAHAVALHTPSHFPDYARLTEVTRKLKPHWAALLQRNATQNAAVGRLMFRMAHERDAGAAKMREAHAARQQLETIVQQWHPQAKVFIFGSSVALGCWDGIADIDFTVVDVEQYEQGVWPPPERNAVRSVTELLRRVGFSYFNLAPIAHARVPIVKHHASSPIRLSEACRAHLRQVYSPPSTTEEASQHAHTTTSSTNSSSKDTALEAEHVIARSVRFQLSEPVTTADRILFEASIQHHLRSAPGDGGQGQLLQSWWNRDGTNYCATFDHTNTAVRAATTTFQLLTPTLRVRAQPLHEEVRPELFNIDFDLSFRAFGIRNSVFLHRYLIQHPCARPGAIVLKEWSKTSGINNSAHGYLTSYAINIMWIYYLVRKGHVAYVDPIADVSEKLRGPLAPPLDPPYIPLVDRSRIDTTSSDEKRTTTTTTGSAAAGRPLATPVDAGELLLGFFYFYACEFDWAHQVVSLNRPGVTTKKMIGWDTEELTTASSAMNNNNNNNNSNNSNSGGGGGGAYRHVTRYSFCIEDPYEENLNLGRHMGITKTCHVLAEFHRALVSLLKDTPAASCVFAGASAATAAAKEEAKEVDADATTAAATRQQQPQKKKKKGTPLCESKHHEAQMLRHKDIFLKTIKEKEASLHPLVDHTVAAVMTKDSMPLRALYILMSVVLKELASRQQRQQQVSPTDASAAQTQQVGIPLQELERLFRQQAPNAFTIASKSWNMQQLVHRLGLKIHLDKEQHEKGVVVFRRELGVFRRTAPPPGVLPLSGLASEDEPSTTTTTAATTTTGAATASTVEDAARLANALPARGLALQLQQALAEGYLRLTPLWTCWSRPWASLRPLQGSSNNNSSNNNNDNKAAAAAKKRSGGRMAASAHQQQKRSYSTSTNTTATTTNTTSSISGWCACQQMAAQTSRKIGRLLFHK